MSTRASEFIELYKQLEAGIKERFPGLEGSAVPWLSTRRDFKHLRAELDYCREVRNLLSHRPKPSSGNGAQFAVEPSEAMLQLLRDVIREVTDPPHIWDAMTQRKDLLAVESLNDYVRPVMAEMSRHAYSYVPMLKNGQVIGVFSSNALIAYLVEDEILEIGPETRFSHLEKFLGLDSQPSESFRFVARDALVSEVSDLFDEAVCNKCKIGAVFVTQNGKPSEKILGMVTAWDVAALA